MLDCSGVPTSVADVDASEFVHEVDNDVIRFASLRVGESLQGVLEDTDVVDVGSNELNVGQVKAMLHLFADSIGTDKFIETLDIRFSDWGNGSGSTTRRFEDFVTENIDLATVEVCTGLRFADDANFNTPGEGGEFFTGGFLDLRVDEFSTLLRSGDIAEIVSDYDITSRAGTTTLTVDAQLGEMVFTINDDQTLTDEFDRVWSSEEPYEIIDPDAVDELIGDIDGSGTVDFADFLILSSQFGSDAQESDLDGDGVVGFGDFLLLSANFGESLD